MYTGKRVCNPISAKANKSYAILSNFLKECAKAGHFMMRLHAQRCYTEIESVLIMKTRSGYEEDFTWLGS